MQLVKIHIPNPLEGVRAILEISQSYRVDCYADQVYIVPEAALEVLKSLSIAFTIPASGQGELAGLGRGYEQYSHASRV